VRRRPDSASGGRQWAFRACAASGAPVGVHGRCTLGQRTRWLATVGSEVGQKRLYAAQQKTPYDLNFLGPLGPYDCCATCA
jgi:hypothetical protein